MLAFVSREDEKIQKKILYFFISTHVLANGGYPPKLPVYFLLFIPYFLFFIFYISPRSVIPQGFLVRSSQNPEICVGDFLVDDFCEIMKM